jgi:hypothetical protein
MNLLFEDNFYTKLLAKVGIAKNGFKMQLYKVVIPFVICWVPLAIMTLINGTFWTGDITPLSLQILIRKHVF